MVTRAEKSRVVLKERKIILITTEVKPSNVSRLPRNIQDKVRIQNSNLTKINKSIKWITNKIEKVGVEMQFLRKKD